MEKYPSLVEGTGLENQEVGNGAGVRIPLSPPFIYIAGWSSLVARRAHNPEAAGSNPASATNRKSLDFVDISTISGFFLFEIFVASVLKNDIKYHRKAQKYKSTCKSKIRKSKTVFERIKS